MDRLPARLSGPAALPAHTTDAAAPVAPSAPWAFALNQSATCGDVEVTLLSLVVVDGLVRVSGIVRVHRRRDVRLASIPDLAVRPLDGPPLSPVAAHVLPHGSVAAAHVLPQGSVVWVTWMFDRPPRVLTEYAASIERIDLAYRAGGAVAEGANGPWRFEFRLPGRVPRRAILAAFA